MKHDQVSERGVTWAHGPKEVEEVEEEGRVSLPFPTRR